MEVNFSEYNVGEFHVDDIKNKSLSIKITEPNTILSGKIITSSNDSLGNIDLVLYELDSNHILREIDRVKTDSLGNYKFNDVLIGYYIIKDSEFNPTNINVNQVLASANTNNIVPWRSDYNVATGYLESGARLNDTKDKVIFPAKFKGSSSSIYVYSIRQGTYELEVEYVGGLRSFNIDVNGHSTGRTYKTPKYYFGKITINIDLNVGQNLLKFYVSNPIFTLTLGIFTLTIIGKVETKYNLVNSTLENGAKVSPSKDVVMNIGGPNNGTAKIVTQVDKPGYYLLTIKYRYGARPFLIDVNTISTGETYTVQASYSGKFSFQVYFNQTINELKFYGIDNKKAPNLGEFELVYIDVTTKPQPEPTPIPVVPTPIPSKLESNVDKGVVINGALTEKGYVLYLGGYNNGQSKVTLTIPRTGMYRIDIDYLNGDKPFKMDVNNRNTGELYRTLPGMSGSFYTIIDLIEGENTIKFYGIYDEHASFLGKFTLDFLLTPPPPPPPEPALPPEPPEQPTDGYSVTKGILRNGAILTSDKNFVAYIGGRTNGSSTVEVDVERGGRYDLTVDFQHGYKPLKLDVNGVYTGTEYTTPTGHVGKFRAVINLNLGKNTIKFYGVSTDYASYLGRFTLDFVIIPTTPILPPGTYNTANGIFENSAILDFSTNFVTNLGGGTDGSTKLTINVQSEGAYKVEIKYLAIEADRNLSIDVNGYNAGIYTPPVTNGLSLSDIKTFAFQVVLISGDNEIKFHGDNVNHAPMLGMFVVSKITTPPPVQDYTYATLNRLSYSDLTNLIKTISWSSVPGLFNFSSDSYQFFRDDNRVQAIINALEESGRLFTTQDEQGIDTLVEFLRAGFYLGYNNSQLGHLDDISYRNRCLRAIKSVVNNANFSFGTDVQDKVVTAIGKLIGNTSADVEILNNLASILEQYRSNMESYNTEYDKNEAVYKIIRESNYFLLRERIRNGDDPQRTSFYGTINPFIAEVEALLENGYRIIQNSEWLVINFIDIAGQLSKFRRDPSITQRILTNSLQSYSYLSRNYLEVLSQIRNNFNSRLSDGTIINYDEKINEAKGVNLPNVYNFDNGEVIIKTGNTVNRNTVQKLYWASKEVKAQFVRVTGNDAPLDTGHVDDVLTMIIYNSPNHYKINYQLYGYSTDNGGIYQEEIGTFFTYDREVPRDSIYTLEELFRHEYVHYLEGRFLVRGLRGSGNFFLGNFSRLTWFTEGTAEFFAGSTRIEGVKARRTIVQNLSSDSSGRMSITNLFSSNTGFNFYKYGFAFVYYMYSRNKGQFIHFSNLIKADDVAGYENYMQVLKSDSTTNSSYYQTIDDLIQNLGSLTTPSSSDDYLTIHSYMTTTQISTDIRSIIYLTKITTETKRSDRFETFTLRGSYDNGLSIDSVSDWNSINRKLDRALISLERKGWSGYKTATAYFTNYRIDRYNNALFDVVFHCILRSF